VAIIHLSVAVLLAFNEFANITRSIFPGAFALTSLFSHDPVTQVKATISHDQSSMAMFLAFLPVSLILEIVVGVLVNSLSRA
jgi:hypothetical protein